VCVCGGGAGWGGETFTICEYSCVSVVQYYSGFVLNCCKTRPELVWKLSFSYQSPHVFVTFDMRVDYGLYMFLYFVFSHVRLMLFCLRRQHCLNRSCMFLQDLLAYVILGPWRKWRYCPFCFSSLYVRQCLTQVFCSGGGGVQQIQLRTEDRENEDLGAVAP